MTFVANLFIVPRVQGRNWIIGLQLLDNAKNFRVLQPILVRSLEPIGYNEGERKKGSFVFIFLGKSVSNHILFSLIVNYLIIISKELGNPFLFL
jgi:hypothetical protein